jgi:hypothetical protein
MNDAGAGAKTGGAPEVAMRLVTQALQQQAAELLDSQAGESEQAPDAQGENP